MKHLLTYRHDGEKEEYVTSEEKMKCAVHCLKVQAGIEVCEDCDAFTEDSSTCEDVAREALRTLGELETLKAKVRRKLELVRKSSPMSRREEGYEEALLAVLSMIHEIENRRDD